MASRSLARPALGVSRRASFTTSSIARAWTSGTTPSWQRVASEKPKSNFNSTVSASAASKPVAAATSTATSKTTPSLATPTSPKSTILNMAKAPSTTTKSSSYSTPINPKKTPSNTTPNTTKSAPAAAASQESSEPENQDPSLYAALPVPTITKQDRAAAIALTAAPHKPKAVEHEIDWVRSYHGISSQPLSEHAIEILTRPLDVDDIEVKPDGIIYLPEIKYRRILNAAFRPGGWAIVPRGDPVVHDRVVTREHALVIDGRFIAQAQGENTFYNPEGVPAAVESSKSNALMRCCKDIGIASELWDPVFIRQFRKQYARQVWCEHVVNKSKRQLWHKVGVPVALPYKVIP